MLAVVLCSIIISYCSCFPQDAAAYCTKTPAGKWDVTLQARKRRELWKPFTYLAKFAPLIPESRALDNMWLRARHSFNTTHLMSFP